MFNFYKQSIERFSIVKFKIIKFMKQFWFDLKLYLSQILPFRPILLLILGIILFLYDFWFRYIRVRLPREIPYDLSLFILFILVFIIILFIIRIIILLRYYYYEREQYKYDRGKYKPYRKPPFKILTLKPLDPRFLQNVYKIFIPFSVLDYYVRNNNYYKRIIKKLVYMLHNGRSFKDYATTPAYKLHNGRLIKDYATPSDLNNSPDRKRIFFKYLLWAQLPSWILLVVFFVDIFYFKKLELMYSFIPLTFIIISGNYIWYSIKETLDRNKAEMNGQYLIEFLNEDMKEMYEDNKNMYGEKKLDILDVLEIVPNDPGGKYARYVFSSYTDHYFSEDVHNNKDVDNNYFFEDVDNNKDVANHKDVDNEIHYWHDYKVHLWHDIKRKIMEKYIIYLKDNLRSPEQEDSEQLFNTLFKTWSLEDIAENKNYVFIFPEERKKLEKEFREDLLPYQLILECIVDKYEGKSSRLQPKRIIVILQISLSVLYVLGWLYILIISIPNFHITELELRIIEEIPELIAQENDSNIGLKVEEGEGIGQMIVLAIGLVIGIIKRKKIKEKISKVSDRVRRWIWERDNPKYTAENIKETVKEMLEEYHDEVNIDIPLKEALEVSFKFYEENLPAEIWKEKEQTTVERIREEISKIGREINDQEQQDEQEHNTLLICCLCKETMLIYSVTQRNKNLDKEKLLDLLENSVKMQSISEILDKEKLRELLENYIETHKIIDIENVMKEPSKTKNLYLIIIGLISVIIVLIVASIAGPENVIQIPEPEPEQPSLPEQRPEPEQPPLPENNSIQEENKEFKTIVVYVVCIIIINLVTWWLSE